MFVGYISPVDNKQHRYFIDLIVKTKKGKVFFIEVKPSSQTVPPKKRKNTQRYLQECAVWSVNQAKWQSATEFAKKKGGEFIVVTEQSLKGWK